MKLDLDFILYTGKTRLRAWWKEVKKHFTAVQDAVNELDETDKKLAAAIGDEAAERKRVDGELDERLTYAETAIGIEETVRREADDRIVGFLETETSNREDADRELADAIEVEAAERVRIEENIYGNISDAMRAVMSEATARRDADDALRKRALFPVSSSHNAAAQIIAELQRLDIFVLVNRDETGEMTKIPLSDETGYTLSRAIPHGTAAVCQLISHADVTAEPEIDGQITVITTTADMRGYDSTLEKIAAAVKAIDEALPTSASIAALTWD